MASLLLLRSGFYPCGGVGFRHEKCQAQCLLSTERATKMTGSRLRARPIYVARA